MSPPAPAPASASNPDTYVLNNYDDNFLNYAELYTKPSDLKVNAANSIGQYANALITGKNDDYVYSDSPDLVGNRYFINTGTQCIDSENKTHTRSVLVDNVLTSTMKKTTDSNTGLMYSLLASMQTLNSIIKQIYPPVQKLLCIATVKKTLIVVDGLQVMIVRTWTLKVLKKALIFRFQCLIQ